MGTPITKSKLWRFGRFHLAVIDLRLKDLVFAFLFGRFPHLHARCGRFGPRLHRDLICFLDSRRRHEDF